MITEQILAVRSQESGPTTKALDFFVFQLRSLHESSTSSC
jgi:hypothetical protein